MYNSNERTKIFNLSGLNASFIFWVISLLSGLGYGFGDMNSTFIVIVLLAIIGLLIEKENHQFRNSAAQIGVLNIAVYLVSILFSIISTIVISLLSFIPLIGTTVAVIFFSLRVVLTLIHTAYNLYGIIKCASNKEIEMPVIGRFGKDLEKGIK